MVPVSSGCAVRYFTAVAGRYTSCVVPLAALLLVHDWARIAILPPAVANLMCD